MKFDGIGYKDFEFFKNVLYKNFDVVDENEIFEKMIVVFCESFENEEYVVDYEKKLIRLK